jgi:hypothetical protein
LISVRAVQKAPRAQHVRRPACIDLLGTFECIRPFQEDAAFQQYLLLLEQGIGFHSVHTDSFVRLGLLHAVATIQAAGKRAALICRFSWNDVDPVFGRPTLT